MEPSEENFDQLKKLLELKRHETPPPGYFEDFSTNLIARIEAEDARPAAAGWRRFLPSFDTSPLMVGSYGVIAASLVIIGVQMAGRVGSSDGLNTDNSLAGTEPVGLAVDPLAAPPAMAADAVIVTETQPKMVTVKDEAEGVARSAPTGMFNPPSIHGGTSSPQRVSFPANQ